jgi:hypothetical protein
MLFKRRKDKDILATQDLLNDPEYKAACQQREKHAEALMQLRKKKGKINVLFFVINASCWKFDTVYQKMSKRKRYNPVILVCPQCDRGEEHKQEQQRNCFEFFKQKGYNVINSFDSATGNYIDAHSLSPDIIFYTNPYEGLIDDRYYISKFSDVLTCYANYAFMNNDEKWSASLPLHKSVWKYFCEYDLTRHYNKVGTKLYYDNRVVVGYPMYDRFVDKSYVGSDWKQQDTSKKRIIYAPHHTIEKDGWIHYSTFLTTGEIMAELRDKYKDKVQFVFKPHPLLKAKLYNAEGWGREKTDAYYEAWANAENSSFVDNDYVDLFKSSDALIHDCGSFIVEYLYVQKPVMHLNNGKIKEELNPEAMEAYQAHYLMDKTEDIEKFITEVVIKGRDTKREAREAVYKKMLIPPHHRLVADNILYEIDCELSTGIRKICYNLKEAICRAFKM